MTPRQGGQIVDMSTLQLAIHGRAVRVSAGHITNVHPPGEKETSTQVDMSTCPPHVHATRQAHNHRLPTWLRIAFWAQAHADHHGHARAYPGDLRRLLGTGPHEVSRAIRLAKDRDLLDDTSWAGCLVLFGYAHHPCDAHHRESA